MYFVVNFNIIKTHVKKSINFEIKIEYCSPLKMDITLKDLISQLQILNQVAIIHQFEWLQEEIKLGLDSYHKNSD